MRSFPDESDWPRCSNPAGHGTKHPGEGYCRFHGGPQNGVIGGTALKTNPRFATLMENHARRDAELLDLRNDLIKMKAFSDLIIEDMHPEGGDMHFDNRMKAADRLIRATDQIGKLTERITDKLAEEAIPLKSFIAAQQEMATTLMAILRAELPPEDVQRIGKRIVEAWDKIHIDLEA